MNSDIAKELLDKIVGQVFGYQNPFTLEQFLAKYAFDVRLPQKVQDSVTGEDTWAQSINPSKFMTKANTMKAGINADGDWMLPTREVTGLADILAIWNETNYMSTERAIEAIDIAESDNIYNSEKIFRSQDVHFSKNILFSDTARKSENSAAIQRSNNVSYSIRVEDSTDIDHSFGIIWSGKITKSFFIQDCFDMYECMFCSHVASKKYCIANMQFTEEEYMKYKDLVIKWILTN